MNRRGASARSGDADSGVAPLRRSRRRRVEQGPVANTLRVATYNIHKGVLRDFFGLKRISRIHELRARLHDLHADLIFLPRNPRASTTGTNAASICGRGSRRTCSSPVHRV